MGAVHHDTGIVPLAHGFQLFLVVGQVHGVVGSGLLPFLQLFGETHVVDELVFGTGHPGRLVLGVFHDPVHQAAVAALRSLPVNAELEVLILLPGDKVGP